MASDHSSLYGGAKEVGPKVDVDVAQGDSDLQEARQENVGELEFDEYTQGGLGRHLGVLSTTFLVYVSASWFPYRVTK